jgi:hypothetical protein
VADRYVWKRGEAPPVENLGTGPPSTGGNPPPKIDAEEEEKVYVSEETPIAEPYKTTKNRIPVKKVSNYGDAFDDGIAFALAYETSGDLETGAPHHHKNDSGGFTKYGIAQNRNPDVDVENLTLEGALDIYREKYWPEAAKVADSAPHLQALYLEGYMNMGGGATRSLQRAIGTDPDGGFGKNTKAALEKALNERGEEAVIREYLWQRSQHYRRIWQNDPSQEVFRDGWQNRIDDVADYFEHVLSAAG